MRKETLLTFTEVINNEKYTRHKKSLLKYKHWFPIKSSPELAGIVADLMGDGHLQNGPWRLDYTSNDVGELRRFNSIIFNSFGIKGKIRKCTTNKYGTMNLGINNTALALILDHIGVPSGAKVFKKFEIPKWILLHKTLFKRFIDRLFSCEGCVDLTSKAVEIKMHKSTENVADGIDFFDTIKIHLNQHFGIVTTNTFMGGWDTVRKDGRVTKAIRLKIRRRSAIVKFNKYIGFENRNKQRKLEKLVSKF
jgi:hypothetical protein